MLEDRIVEVLEKDDQDDILLQQLEVAYAQSTGRGLKEDLSKNGQNYMTLFERGLTGRNGVIYMLGTNTRGQQVIHRILQPYITPGYGVASPPFNGYPAAINMNHYSNFLHSGAKYAKIAEIYDVCNKELEKDQFGEIPLEFLEERVTENLFAKNILLTEGHKGQNFSNLVQRASGNYIRGVVRDGKLCRSSNIPVQVGNLTAPSFTDEPPPPYRPPSSYPHGKQSLELLDSDEEYAENFDNTQQAPPLPQKYSRFSGPNMNIRSNKSELPQMEKETYRPPSSVRDRNKHICESVKDNLIRKYFDRKVVHISGNEEETIVQMEAMRECLNLWEDKIENFCEFLYTLKQFWLKNRTISVFDIDSKMFDNVIDSSGMFSLEWNVFGITEDDLAPLNLFVRVSSNSKLNQIEVNPLIQQADFLMFNSGTLPYRVYQFLQNSTKPEEFLQRLAQHEKISTADLMDQLIKWPEIFRIDEMKGKIQLNTPFPFFILGDFS